MKTIIKIVDVTDNWGGTEEYNTPEQIRNYLDSPGYFSDDATYHYTEGNEMGICFIDDILDTEVMIGDEVYQVKEKE